MGLMGIKVMEKSTHAIGFSGITLGAIALLIAIVHLWAGPFSPQPSLEKTVAEKAVAIKNATIAALKGEEIEEQAPTSSFDVDQALSVATGVLGGLAIILGVVGYARKEPLRVAGGAVALGGAAIAFQFVVVALGMIFLAVLVVSVLSGIGFS